MAGTCCTKSTPSRLAPLASSSSAVGVSSGARHASSSGAIVLSPSLGNSLLLSKAAHSAERANPRRLNPSTRACSGSLASSVRACHSREAPPCEGGAAISGRRCHIRVRPHAAQARVHAARDAVQGATRACSARSAPSCRSRSVACWCAWL
eukprot:1295762-Prymnesium_polylepis.2